MCRGQQTHWSVAPHRSHVWMLDCDWLTTPIYDGMGQMQGHCCVIRSHGDYIAYEKGSRLTFFTRSAVAPWLKNLEAHLKSACNAIIQIYPKVTAILTNSLIINRLNIMICCFILSSQTQIWGQHHLKGELAPSSRKFLLWNIVWLVGVSSYWNVV